MSTSPRWDTRNQGFVPPTQLRKTRPTMLHATSSSSDSAQLEPRPQHTRTSSFFSFSSKKSAQQQAQKATQTAQRRGGQSSAGVSGHMQSPSTPASTHTKRPSIGEGPLPTQHPAVQREIKSVVDLSSAHAHKIYFSGPLVRRIERLPDGNRPARDDGWVDVWAQLGGTTLSVWDMKAIEEASKRGEEVPPSYVNVTDAFVQVLGALTSPATPTAPAKRYTNVITLNTAGSNLMLFACPSSQALVSWAAALRLAGWEKSRLEEIYTGHLLRMSLSEGDSPWKEPATTLVRGRLEGQVKVRVAGQTDWKPLWMILSSSGDPTNAGFPRPTSPTSTRSKNRMSNLFSRAQSPPPTGPALPTISLYASNKPKDRRKPILTMRYVTQAFAVYPERPEVIPRSTLIKIEGRLGDEELGGSMKGREGWLMLMPETSQAVPVLEGLKWLIAFHDAYSLYGRPAGYIWDPRQPPSMWFAYPVGAQRAHLFFDRELAESLDPRDDRTSIIRKNLKQILVDRMYGPSSPSGQSPPQIGQTVTQPREGSLQSQNQNQGQRPAGAPILPPIQSVGSNPGLSVSTPQLPPLNFNGVHPQQPNQAASTSAGPSTGSGPDPRPTPPSRGVSSLTPITERSPIDPRGSSPKPPPQPGPAEPHTFSNSSSSFNKPPPEPERQSSQASGSLNGAIVKSPIEEPQGVSGIPRSSEDSYAPGSRPDSELAKSTSYGSTGFDAAESKASSAMQSPSTKQSPTDGKSISDEKSPSTIQSYYPLTLSTHTSLGVASAQNSLPRTQSQGTVPSPRPASRAQSPALDSVHSPRVPSEVHISPVPEQSHNRLSPPPLIQTVASISSNTHFPSLQKPRSQAPSPPPKSDTGSSTPAILRRDWPQPPPGDGTSPPPAPLKSPSDQEHDLASSPGALYLLQRAHQTPDSVQPPRDTWTTDENEQDEQDEQDEQESDYSGPERNPPPRRGGTPPLIQTPLRPEAESQMSSHAAGRSNLGRKPSGARAKPNARRYPDPTSSLEPVTEPVAGPSSPPQRAMAQPQGQHSPAYDDNADALAALSFLENQEDSAPPSKASVLPSSVIKNDPSPPSSETQHYPSTFAPSKQAAERKAKAQAQQEATYAATHLPGKPNGNPKTKKKDQGAWAESSDEDEDDDEEEEEEEDGSDDETPARVKQPQALPASDPRVSVYPSAQPQGPPGPAGEVYGPRQPRTLPQPPVRPAGSAQDHQSPHARVASSQYDDRPRTHAGDEPRGHTINPHQVARQSVWSTVLDPQPPPRNTSGKDTFVQVDQSETMTKAFQPQGLLSAGLQDKEDRSAKRQEELARETGASLINVPNKPPPPQTGLLGAITAHERERKREGGVGAALTEKERERRLAEERQRKLDDLQRQQLDQYSQAGGPGVTYDPYGQQQFPGFGQNFDPRMSMPMMLNPYMAGGFPMMPFGNPQQMMAAQLAAQQAYQQAMMSFSQAGGSQAGDNASRMGGSPAMAPHSPQGGMLGTPSPVQGGMMGMDPRMSMLSPMMGGGMGMNPMMGGMGMNQMMGMGMGQNFDPRMSVAQSNFHQQRPDSGQGLQSAYQGTPSPRQDSPVPQRSGNNSPRPY